MVKQRKKHSKKKRAGKGFNKNTANARKINASTPVETCTRTNGGRATGTS